MKSRYQQLLVCSLFVFAVFFSLYKLTESPGVWYDEGFYYQSASNLATYGHTGLQLAPGYVAPSSRLITVSYPLIYPMALWFKIFGQSVLVSRSFMVLFLLAFIAAGYFLSRRLFGPRIALAVLALLATFPPLYANGKSMLGEVPGMLYLLLCLICLNAFFRKTAHARIWLILAGFTAGLCVTTKPIFLPLLPAIAVGLFFAYRRKEMGWKDIALASAFGLLPCAAGVAVQFQGNDSLMDVLSFYANPYQIKDLSSLILQNIRTLFTDVSTLYLMGMMAVWSISFWIRGRAEKRAIPAVEIISAVFSLLIIAAFVRTAGWYRYLFEAQLLAIIFFPHSLGALMGAMKRDRLRSVMPVAVVLLAALSAYQLMFDSWVAGAYSSHKTAYWQEYFKGLSPASRLFFFDTPEVAMLDYHRNYNQYFNPSGFEIGAEQLPVLRRGGADVVVVRTDTYAGRTDGIFGAYKVATTTYKYSILKKK